MSESDAIVVTGLGVVSPYGTGLDLLQAGMLAGRCCLEPSTGYYPGFAGSVAAVRDLPPAETRPDFWPSRTDRLAVLAARDAVASLGGDCPGLADGGVVMATTVAGLTEIEPEIVHDPAAWYRRHSLARAASYPVAHVADAVGDALGLRGPRCAVTVACASGAMSIALAATMLLDGVADVMLAGGSDALCPFTLSGFGSLQALDPSPCRPFDKNRAGLNLGEGAAVLVLETFRHASARGARVLAMLRGWAMTNDAFHPTAPHEHGAGLAACIVSAMEMAGVGPDEIGYVNAHGTGTPLNDVAETKAYESAFRQRSRPIPVSSTKSYFGHCLGAAGALEAAITIAAIRAGALFPTLRLADPIDSPSVDWLTELRRESLPVAMSVSAGFGGSNAALVFGTVRFSLRAQAKAYGTATIVGIGSVTPYGTITGPITPRPIQPAAGAYRVQPFRPTDVVPGLKTRRLDRLSVWSLVAASLAIKDSGLDLSTLDRSRIAVVFGTGLGCIELTEAFFQSADKYGWSGTDAAVFPETLGNSPASHVARVLDLRGANLTVSSKGHAGECALDQAASLLRHGQADFVVVLAGDTLTRTVSDWFEIRRVGRQACQLSEGVVAVVLTTEPTAHSYGPLRAIPATTPSDPVARGLVDSGALLRLVLELP